MERDVLVGGAKQLPSRISHVEIQLSIRSENKGVCAVVMVSAFDPRKNKFTLVCNPVLVGVRQNKYVGGNRHDDFVPKNADSQRRIDALVLIEHRLLIRATVVIGIFETNNPVSGFIEGSPFLER